MDTSFPETRRHYYVKSLDGIRGLAILTVVVHNASWIQTNPLPSIPVKVAIAATSTGWVGVSLFFVLSGTLITWALLSTKSSPDYLQSFFIRRALRIFPLYYAFLALAFWAGPFVVDNTAWQADVQRNQLWYWTYLQNWPRENGAIAGLPHLWSLAVEEQFYVAWPFVVMIASRRQLLGICFVLLLSAPLLRFFLIASSAPDAQTFCYTVVRWDALAAGALVATLFHSNIDRKWLTCYALPVFIASGAALLGFLSIHHGFHSGDPPVDILGQSLVATFFATMIACTILRIGRCGALLQNAFSRDWLCFLGKYSYAIYMFHAPLHHASAYYLRTWVNDGGSATTFMKLIAYNTYILCSSILLALASWYFLERHFLGLRNRLAPKASLRPPH